MSDKVEQDLALARECALENACRNITSPGTLQMLESAYRNGMLDNTETVVVALLAILRARQATEARIQATVEIAGLGEAGVQVGRFTLTPGWQPGHVWVYADGGEGGEFAASDLEAVIEAFYRENF